MNRDYIEELKEVTDLLEYALEDYALNMTTTHRLLSRLKALEVQLQKKIESDERSGRAVERMKAHINTLHEFYDDTVGAFKQLTPF